MALVQVTVYKFKAGAECFVPCEDDGFLVWQHDPEGGFESLERHETYPTEVFDFVNFYDSRCLTDNYAVMLGPVIADEFCGESLDGVAWEVDQIGMRDTIWNGIPEDDFANSYYQEEVQYYINIAEKRVRALLTKRKQEEPGFWRLTFHTAWNYYETVDTYWNEVDGGCECVGIMDITHKFEVQVQGG